MTSGGKLHLVYTSDNGYVLPTIVSVASALAWASDTKKIVIDVLDCGIDDNAWSRLDDVVGGFGATATRYKIDMSRFGGLKSYCGSFATYARIITPEVLASEDWCVFVDGDTLFVEDPLKLNTFYLENVWFVGHRDWGLDFEYASWLRAKQAWFHENGLKFDASQFVCMGFVIMNLRLLRQEHFADKCLALLAITTPSKCADQEVMNAIGCGHIAYLPEAWGCFNLGLFSQTTEPKLIHYTISKPWRVNTIFTHALPDADRYWFLCARKFAGLTFAEVANGRRAAYCFRRFVAVVYRLLDMLPIKSCRLRSKLAVVRPILADAKTWRRWTLIFSNRWIEQ